MTDINALLPHVRLQFNIEHPSLEECYLFGYECAIAEVDEGDNPFDENSLEHEQWLEGWWAGLYGEKPLYNASEPQEEVTIDISKEASNDKWFIPKSETFVGRLVRVTGTIAATAVVGYQLIDLVA